MKQFNMKATTKTKPSSDNEILANDRMQGIFFIFWHKPQKY